jgi:hypothetical protein
MWNRIWVGWLIAAAACVLMGGCSQSSDLAISGKVTVDGEPAQSGSIMFTPVDGKSKVAGGEIKDGTYNVEVPPGEKLVQIRATRLVEAEIKDELTGKTHKTQNPVRLTSEEYESPRSPLKANVTKAGEKFDFDLPKIEDK